jgi:FkbM family methyltransferase
MVVALSIRSQKAAFCVVLAFLVSYQLHFLSSIRSEKAGINYALRLKVTQQEKNPMVSIMDAIVQCPAYVQDVRQGRVPSVLDPNEGSNREELQAKTHPEEPSFWVSLHNKKFDRTRWGIKTYGYYYERALERIWRSILAEETNTKSVVLDVGANIGYFTLLSLAMGDSISVHSFEPNPVNYLRLCESMDLNGWNERPNAFLYSVGVSDRNQAMSFVALSGNPGNSYFVSTPDESQQTKGALRKAISLDFLAEELGWFKSRPNVAILKVDVEGQELNVLRGAKRLLEERLVHNVFVEIYVKERVSDARDTLSILLGHGFKAVGMGGFSGPKKPVPWPHDADIVQRLLDEADSEKAKLLNLWFQLDT